MHMYIYYAYVVLTVMSIRILVNINNLVQQTEEAEAKLLQYIRPAIEKAEATFANSYEERPKPHPHATNRCNTCDSSLSNPLDSV